MKYILPIIILFSSCTINKESSETAQNDTAIIDTTALTEESSTILEEKVENNEILSSIKLDSSYCNGNTLLKIHRNFENLTKDNISELLSTFHKDCSNNVEFSEWSNELLYRTFDKYTKGVMDLLTSENDYEMENILSELESPINDAIMPLPLINRIKEMGYNDQAANSILDALQISADKY